MHSSEVFELASRWNKQVSLFFQGAYEMENVNPETLGKLGFQVISTREFLQWRGRALQCHELNLPHLGYLCQALADRYLEDCPYPDDLLQATGTEIIDMEVISNVSESSQSSSNSSN